MEKKRIQILENIIKQMLVPVKNIPLYLVIESLCGKKIISYDNFIKDDLIKVINNVVDNVNLDGIFSKRVNEVGNYIEEYVLKSFKDFNYDAVRPPSKNGKKRSTGYPDIYLEIDGRSFYIECKTYNLNNIGTTQRSFYLSPSKDFKVIKDAYHLIFAFSIYPLEGNFYKVNGLKILDAKELLCDVKYEFNSDNKRIYGEKGLNVIYEKMRD